MLAWKIALRYLFSKKSHGAVNIISIISVTGVAIATMAIIIVMSVFNGFTDLAAKHLSILDPQLKVSPVSGKVFANGDSLAQALSHVPCVAHAMPVLEERALVIFGSQQMPVIIKGVPADYNKHTALDSVMIDGEYLIDHQGLEVSQISAGVAVKTNARPGPNNVISVYVPRRMGRINPANPAAAFSGLDFVVSGVFRIGQPEYDSDHIFIQLSNARELLQYETEASSIEIMLRPGYKDVDAQAMLQKRLGPKFKVETRLQQQEAAFRMINIEKWVTFLMLAFILIIASFNIISTLSLLVIEKRSNMLTLRAMGAPMSMIRSIFIYQGWLISVIGGTVGLIVGTLLALGQKTYGWVKLSGDPSQMIISAYPVQVKGADVIIVFALVVIVGLLTSQVTRFFTNDKIQREQ